MSKYSPFEDSARLFEPQGTANNSRGSGADRGQVEALEQQQYEEDEQQHEEEDEEEDGVLDADEDYYGAGTGGYGGLGGEAVLDEEGYQADPFMNVPRFVLHIMDAAGHSQSFNNFASIYLAWTLT